MRFIQFRQDFFHNGFPEQNGFATDTETFAIQIYCIPFFVIQINDLPVAPDKRILLPVKKIGRYIMYGILFPFHK